MLSLFSWDISTDFFFNEPSVSAGPPQITYGPPDGCHESPVIAIVHVSADRDSAVAVSLASCIVSAACRRAVGRSVPTAIRSGAINLGSLRWP
jgi:hypothetical protein